MTDNDSDARMATLIDLLAPLDRQQFGDDAATETLLRHLPALPAQPRVADLGCGTGPSALVLARILGVTVDCIDTAPAFLDRLRERAGPPIGMDLSQFQDDQRMAGRWEKPEDSVLKLRQVEVLDGQRAAVAGAVRQVGITQQSYHRWRKQYGGMSRDQLKRLK